MARTGELERTHGVTGRCAIRKFPALRHRHAVALALLLVLESSLAQPPPVDSAATKTVRIQRAAEPPVIDGVMDEEIWQRAPVVADFHQVAPVEFAEPSERSEVFILYDRDALYVGARFHDAEPQLINARVLRQGQPIGSDDRFFVHIDPFNSRRSGYLFGVNANGVRFDGVFEGVTQRQFDWDGIWQAAAQITADGWVVEISIPLKTLSFDPSTTTWRMNFARNIERKNGRAQFMRMALGADCSVAVTRLGAPGPRPPGVIAARNAACAANTP